MRLVRGIRQVIAELVVFDDVPDHIDAEAIDAAVEPEPQHIEHRLLDFGISPIEVGLLFQETRGSNIGRSSDRDSRHRRRSC